MKQKQLPVMIKRSLTFISLASLSSLTSCGSDSSSVSRSLATSGGLSHGAELHHLDRIARPLYAAPHVELMSYRLSGCVVDQRSGKPMSAVEVRFMDKTVRTNANGFWSIDHVAPDCQMRGGCFVTVTPAGGFMPGRHQLIDHDPSSKVFISQNNTIRISERRPAVRYGVIPPDKDQ
jgi:hypothetical protein